MSVQRYRKVSEMPPPPSAAIRKTPRRRRASASSGRSQRGAFRLCFLLASIAAELSKRARSLATPRRCFA